MAVTPNRMKGFYAGLIGVLVVGAGALGWMLTRPRTTSIPANVTVQASDTAGFRGYLLGSDTAKVEITEYADYQCPFCQTFDQLQMPTIKKDLIDSGRLRWRYRDFPLQQHPFSRLAAHSAACADEQSKYWPQHHSIYDSQQDWAQLRDAAPKLRQYAQANGLDLGRYDSCMQSAKYAGRIQASYDEGVQVGVSATPTLMVGGRLYQGRLDSDAIARLVDSLTTH
ncbi:MAG TPA: thioredoxin domain-containing protein [Gemmatimonadales bacterium]|nr:thioredoxin domain-containing protein [Gemmatimonadales bacterium]